MRNYFAQIDTHAAGNSTFLPYINATSTKSTRSYPYSNFNSKGRGTYVRALFSCVIYCVFMCVFVCVLLVDLLIIMLSLHRSLHASFYPPSLPHCPPRLSLPVPSSPVLSLPVFSPPPPSGYPDISLLGVKYIVAINGSFYPLDGTSASAPLAAAMVSLVNNGRVLGGRSTLGD